MKLLLLKDAEDIAIKGAGLAADIIRNEAKHSDTLVVGLAGGRSLVGIYRQLVKCENLAWKKLHFFWVDERRLPLTDAESNYRVAEEFLLAPLLQKGKISKENIHPFPTELPPHLALQEYTQELNKYGGGFDLALLGAGEDGHIAAVFPEMLYNENQAFNYFDNSPKAPAQRFTASPALLAACRNSIVVYSGESKRDALLHFLKEDGEKTLPEKTLKKMKALRILTDQKV